MKKVLYYLLLAVLIGVFAFSAYKIGSYLVEKHKSEQVTKAAEEFTTPVETDEEQTTKEPERISVDFDALRQQNGDVVAWLYGADTGLNYPVVQADDNDYYLYRLLDGSYNKNGTLFVARPTSPAATRSSTATTCARARCSATSWSIRSRRFTMRTRTSIS